MSLIAPSLSLVDGDYHDALVAHSDPDGEGSDDFGQIAVDVGFCVVELQGHAHRVVADGPRAGDREAGRAGERHAHLIEGVVGLRSHQAAGPRPFAGNDQLGQVADDRPGIAFALRGGILLLGRGGSDRGGGRDGCRGEPPVVVPVLRVVTVVSMVSVVAPVVSVAGSVVTAVVSVGTVVGSVVLVVSEVTTATIDVVVVPLSTIPGSPRQRWRTPRPARQP